MSKKDTDLGVVIGIDFGTTNSCVAVCKNKKVEIIANESGNRTTPSYVAYTSEGQRLIGEPAKDQSFRNPKNTIYNVKRLLGCNCNDEFVQKLIKNYPFEVIQKNSRFYFKIETGKGTKFFSVEEISAMVLKRLVRVAQEYLNEKIKNVVISVPAYFNDSQRQATKNAGTIAGLNVLRIINEPTAAAMAYGFHTLKHDGTILVFDFGGGTLDVTILKIKHKTFTVLSTSGNGHLGGEDFDQNVINHFIKVYEDKKRKNIRNDKRAVLRLKREVEKAKRALTFSASTRIEIDCFVREEDFSETLTRDKFEEINKNLFGEILKPIEQALKDAGLTISDIDEIIMVGGSSRIPKVRQMVKDFFNGKEPFQRINAEEAIAYGAAIQAGILSGQQDSIILFDVTPISLGVELGTKELMKFIPRNTIIPTKKTQIMTTYKDYQTEILFAVYEGESPNATDNLLLGKFILADIPPKPQSVAQIEVIFEIDDNGILQVSAKDLETNKMEKIIIRYEENRPTFEEMKIMIKDDNEYEDKIDQAIRKRMEFTDLLHSTKSSICDNKKLTNFQKKKMEIIIQENIKWLQDNASYEPKIYIQRRKKFEQTIKSIQNQ